MAKKMRKAEKPRRELTKRQLSHWQKQRRRQRIILNTGISIIAAVLLIVLVGWYSSDYRPLHQTVIRVNDTEYNMKYYVEMLKLNGGGQSASAIVKSIEQNALITQEALKLGISVSKDEIKAELKNSGLPDNDVYRDLVGSELLADKLRNEYFELQVPLFADQRQVTAMLLESDSKASEVRARLENGESFTELAGELSLEDFTKTNKGDLGWHTKNIFDEMLPTPVVGEYAFNSEAGVLSQPIYDEEISKGLGYWLINVLEANEEDKEAHVNAMLLSSQEQTENVIYRLIAGEEFATLAEELSQLPGADSNQGELGIINPGKYSPVFDDFVFNPDTPLKTLSDPLFDESVATKGGYWLIQVLDSDDNRRIVSRDRDWLKIKALNEWASSLWDNPGNEVDDSFLDAEKREWAIERVTRG
ncbi:peptidylprolyl isomerase [Chloroflexota bacterium]